MKNLSECGLSCGDGHAFRTHGGFLCDLVFASLVTFGGFSASCYEQETQSEDCNRGLSSLNETHDIIAGY